LVIRGGGLGLPFIPVVAAELEGSRRGPAWLAALLAAAFAAGLAGRIRGLGRVRIAGPRTWWTRAPLAFVAAATLAGLWAPMLALPRPPGGMHIDWPPVWGVVIVAGAAAGGAFYPQLVRTPARVV